jgi:hypothetical protein
MDHTPSKLLPRHNAVAELELYSDTVQTPTLLLIYINYRRSLVGVHHARKWIAANVADQTIVLDLHAQADEALEAALRLPDGPAHTEAMRKAQQLRLVADARRARLANRAFP